MAQTTVIYCIHNTIIIIGGDNQAILHSSSPPPPQYFQSTNDNYNSTFTSNVISNAKIDKIYGKDSLGHLLWGNGYPWLVVPAPPHRSHYILLLGYKVLCLSVTPQHKLSVPFSGDTFVTVLLDRYRIVTEAIAKAPKRHKTCSDFMTAIP